MELWATQYIIFNVLWTKGPRIDFEIPVCLYEKDVICKEKSTHNWSFHQNSEHKHRVRKRYSIVIKLIRESEKDEFHKSNESIHLEPEEISMHMLFTTVTYNYYFLILLDFCFASCE